jgi:hypothetical protein
MLPLDLNKTPAENDLTVPNDFNLEEDDGEKPTIKVPINLLTDEKLDKQILITKEKQYFSNLSQEEIDDMFPIEEPKEKVPIIKKVLGLYKGAEFFNRDKMAASSASLSHLQHWRFNSYMYYEADIKNGFYTGWLTTCRCSLCDSILSCFPSTYKRVYWLRSLSCPYCTKGIKKPNENDAEICRVEAAKWQKYHNIKLHEHFIIEKRKRKEQ